MRSTRATTRSPQPPSNLRMIPIQVPSVAPQIAHATPPSTQEVMTPVTAPVRVTEPTISEPITSEPITSEPITEEPLPETVPNMPSTSIPAYRDSRPAIFNSDNCIMCGTVLCNINAHAGFTLFIAFVLLICLGIWMALKPDLFNQLFPVASFLLGVIFPSPVFTSMINKKPHTPQEYEEMVNIISRRQETAV